MRVDTLDQILGRLVGCELASVQFVRDYVQLRFEPSSGPDEPVLTCNAPPVVEQDGRRLSDGDGGWADALRALIGQTVIGTDATTGIGIHFESGLLRMSPTRDELTGPEIALLTGFEDGVWIVWRHGEPPFEDG